MVPSGFQLPLPPAIDPAEYSAVIVWCESFGQFITANEVALVFAPLDRGLKAGAHVG